MQLSNIKQILIKSHVKKEQKKRSFKVFRSIFEIVWCSKHEEKVIKKHHGHHCRKWNKINNTTKW